MLRGIEVAVMPVCTVLVCCMQVDHAYQSSDVNNVLGTFAATLAASGWTEPTPGSNAPAENGKAAPPAPAVLVSSTTGQAMEPGSALGQAYWAANMRYTVQFAAVASQLSTRCDVVVEVGPRSVLAGYLAASAPKLAVIPAVSSPATELQVGVGVYGHSVISASSSWVISADSLIGRLILRKVFHIGPCNDVLPAAC